MLNVLASFANTITMTRTIAENAIYGNSTIADFDFAMPKLISLLPSHLKHLNKAQQDATVFNVPNFAQFRSNESFSEALKTAFLGGKLLLPFPSIKLVQKRPYQILATIQHNTLRMVRFYKVHAQVHGKEINTTNCEVAIFDLNAVSLYFENLGTEEYLEIEKSILLEFHTYLLFPTVNRVFQSYHNPTNAPDYFKAKQRLKNAKDKFSEYKQETFGVNHDGSFICEVSEQDFRDAVGSLMEILYLCSLVRRHYTVRVTEKKDDARKVTTWNKPKPHHLILAAEHAKQLGGGVRDFNGEITLAMHKRRAHLRLLSSPYYKHKMGEKVWVKSCWVGPKEWEGSDGKIYKVLDTSELMPNLNR